jgi:hypothetical protein
MKPMQPIQRRAFLRNAGAAVAASTATAAGAAGVAAATSQQPSEGTVKPGDDERAIHQLHHAFLARLNSGQRDGLGASPSPLPTSILGDAQHLDTISIAPDQQRATARFHCLARLDTALHEGASRSLLEMARQQGQGVIQRWESGVLQSEYVKVASLWKLANISFEPTASSETPPAPTSEPVSAPL